MSGHVEPARRDTGRRRGPRRKPNINVHVNDIVITFNEPRQPPGPPPAAAAMMALAHRRRSRA